LKVEIRVEIRETIEKEVLRFLYLRHRKKLLTGQPCH